MRRIKETWEQAMPRLDELRPSLAVSVGVLLFGVLGLLLAFLPTWGYLIGLLGVTVLLCWLAFSGQPVIAVHFTVARSEAVVHEAAVEQPPEPANLLRRPLDEPLTMVELAGGTFLMGSPETEKDRHDDEGPRHQVRVSAFAIGKVTVTQRSYQGVMGENPSHFHGEDLPVENVSWLDAVQFCNQLSEQAGLAPCYRIDGARVEWDRSADGYRLPTEAEWEYACRAGMETAYSFGDDPAHLGEHAWYAENSEGRTHEVGQKPPNQWGLQDLHGNVWEWCWDWYESYKVTNDNVVDPVGPVTGHGRVLRGGAFSVGPQILRAASRNGNEPADRNLLVGFRCVRGSRRQP